MLVRPAVMFGLKTVALMKGQKAELNVLRASLGPIGMERIRN